MTTSSASGPIGYKILCERECRSCGAPLGRVWARRLAPGEKPKNRFGRNQTDEEIGERFFRENPELVDVEWSEIHFSECSACYSPY